MNSTYFANTGTDELYLVKDVDAIRSFNDLKLVRMKYLLSIILVCTSLTGYASNFDSDSIKQIHTVLYEKVYLHIDRELYTPGEDVWIKSYLVSGINNRLIPGYKNIYIQLIGPDGSIADQKLLLSYNGVSKGDLHLKDSIPEGIYTIRAYTKYLQNFGEESFFHKKIVVAGARNSIELEEESANKKQTAIDLALLPEGGNFVLNAVNRIAFKAVDETGKGINVSGTVTDDTGDKVVSFQSAYKGMGSFIIMPQEERTYTVHLDSYPATEYKLPEATIQGISLNYKSDVNFLVFTLSGNIKINNTRKYLLEATHKGMELFSSQIELNGFQQAVRLFKGLFPLGISQVTLYAASGDKVAERLVFVRNNDENHMQLTLNKEEFKTRDRVALDLLSLLPDNDTILSTLSLAVVNEDYFSNNGNNQNIQSYLLLDSELKGALESPASLFIDEPGITANEKLDLVMMINGWRSYYWNDLEIYAGADMPGWADYGLTLQGMVTRLWGNKPADFAKVKLGPFSRNFLFEKDTTDVNGNFSFHNLYLKDSALIMINAETKNRSSRTNISVEQMLAFDSLVSDHKIDSLCPDVEIPFKFYRDIYYRQIADQEYEKELGGILLNDVNIEGQQGPRLEGHFRLYGEPDHSFTITSDDWTYSSIAEYLEARVPGVVVTGDQIRIREGYGNPLLLVDGIEVNWDYIKYLPMGDIDKIEILKSAYLTAIYGSNGGDGIIAILTKVGRGDMHNEFVRNIPGRITPRVKGFQQPKAFYSPKYTPENINDPKPDYRPTLFWDPEVTMSEGAARLEFFTGDNLSRYHIKVEGISKNGKIICATGLLTVNIRR